jgi:hypothetical protein
LCRERVFAAFVVWIPMLTIEITLLMISPLAGNQVGEGLSLYVAAVTGAQQFIWLILRLGVVRRIARIMSADQTFYDEWWKGFSSDPSNRPHLEALRQQVSLVNDSIREASQDAAMLAATHRLARSTELAGAASDASMHAPPSALALEEGGVPGWRLQGGSGLHKWMRVLRRMGSSVCGWSGQGAAAAPARGVEGSDVVRQLVKEPRALVDFADLAYLQAFNGRAFVSGHSYASNTAPNVSNVGLANLLSCRPSSHRQHMSRWHLKVARSMDTLFQQAACLRPILQRKMEAYVGTTPHACRIGGSLQTPLKDPTRAVEKTQRVYGGDCSRLLDICRECLVFDVLEDLVVMLDRLRQDPEIQIVRIKNRLDPNYDSSTLSAGYRDVMVNIQVRNSETMSLNIEFHIAEIQLIPRAVYERRTSGTNIIITPDGQGWGRLGGSDGNNTRVLDVLRLYSGHMNRPEFSGHMNYVLWRDLRGK